METPSREQLGNERQQLQQAIAALEAQRAVLGDAVVDAALASMHEKLARLDAQEAERTPQLKFVTILFTDIAGSTRMGQALDEEDTLAVMDGALQRFGQVIERQAAGFYASWVMGCWRSSARLWRMKTMLSGRLTPVSPC